MTGFLATDFSMPQRLEASVKWQKRAEKPWESRSRTPASVTKQ